MTAANRTSVIATQDVNLQQCSDEEQHRLDDASGNQHLDQPIRPRNAQAVSVDLAHIDEGVAQRVPS